MCVCVFHGEITSGLHRGRESSISFRWACVCVCAQVSELGGRRGGDRSHFTFSSTGLDFTGLDPWGVSLVWQKTRRENGRIFSLFLYMFFPFRLCESGRESV